MTEGHTVLHDNYDKPMCIRVWLEVGHACEPRPRSAFGRSLALDWRIWVRSPRGLDISAFVHKVVFHLNPPSAFVYPKRVIQEPPFEIQESGSTSIDIPIHVYLKHCINPKRIKLHYSLNIENLAKSSHDRSCVYYDIENPSEVLYKLLMKGGGEVLPRTGHLNGVTNNLLVIVSDENGNPPRSGRKKHAECKHLLRKITKTTAEENCSKCVDFDKMLRGVKMTKSEIDLVSKLYLSYNSYEKSVDALVLPPLSDPIYKVPELPVSLRGFLTSIESDYAMQ